MALSQQTNRPDVWGKIQDVPKNEAKDAQRNAKAP